MQVKKPTKEQFSAYQAMFRYFNRTLFGGELRDVILNFSRHARSLGFFAPERWERGDDAASVTHEISLNPDTIKLRTPRDVASTLVHEMVHLWQQDHGTPSRRGYHNAEWADKMETLGLVPSHTGEPGGNRVGPKMTHFIAKDGAFARAFDTMPSDYLLPWSSGDFAGVGTPKPKDPSKIKYTCAECGTNVWGKGGLSILCGECGEPFVEAS